MTDSSSSAADTSSEAEIVTDRLATESGHLELKRKTAHGALVSTFAQAINFVVRIGSMVVLARLISKEDFGVVGMVTAFTGFLGLFRDFGLSMATVQRATISNDQTSTLFWINFGVGITLALICTVASPGLVHFYGEPRLAWIAIAIGSGFIFNGAAAQHRAIMQRAMRFTALSSIDSVSLIVSAAIGIGSALAGAGYWAIVLMAISQPAGSALGIWLATRWIPGRPRKGIGIRSMLQYGGAMTLNNIIIYAAYNMDKVLVGKFLGAEALGIYGRAYQLTNIPTENLYQTLGTVAFPGLSRVQNDPERQRRYFLKGYALFFSLATPITVACALFADDIVLVLLGPKWAEAAPIFRLLAPTILAFAFLNPLGWLLSANGRAVRLLKIACLVAPVVILGYALGLKHGPHGVAAGFSISMVLLIIPVLVWALHGTLVTWKDILKTVAIPFTSIAVAAITAWLLEAHLSPLRPAFLRLTVESSVLLGTFLFVLLIVFKQWSVYIGLLRDTGIWKARQPQTSHTS